MIQSLKRHWLEYMMEAVGLAGFVVGASLLTTLLAHPDSPVMQAIDNPVLRRVPLALCLGVYITGVVYLCGERSGAHINPAVTLAFLSLGKIKRWDAVFYILAQFAGAVAAAQLMKVALGEMYAHPSINYVVTTPDKTAHGVEKAFVAEFVISFVLMFVVLVFINSRRLEKLAGLVTGLLIAAYLVVETPYSGMSLNPARSFGSALAAGYWSYLWIYFTAPVLAMLLAAGSYRLLAGWQKHACAEQYRHGGERCAFCDYKESPSYPVEKATK